MKNSLRILIYFVIMVGSFSALSQTIVECDSEDVAEYTSESINCDNFKSNSQNIPHSWHSVPIKEISVMYHIVRDDNGLNNYQDSQDDIDLLEGYIDVINNIYSNLAVPSPTPGCNNTHIFDSKIRFVLQGIKYYNNSEFICTDTKCTSAANEVFKFCVEDNNNLSSIEKNNFFPILVVGFRGERVNNQADCDRVGCNNPNFFLGGLGPRKYNIVRGMYVNKLLTQQIGELLAHELGHSLGLSHSWVENCCDIGSQNSTNNVMDYSSFSKTSFVECQLGEMHYLSENSTMNPYLNNDLCDKQSGKVIIPEGMSIHWNSNEIVSEDVEIHGSLKITCDVKVANNVRFTVFKNGSLDVDGGHIYGCDEWYGIVVEGDAATGSQTNAGKVMMRNNAIIENAKTAISMNPSHLPWPQIQDMWGGLVQAENSTIRNCHRAVEFMKYGVSFIDDESYFKNCTFENMTHSAITMWADNGVVFEGCTFNNVTENGIYAYDSKVEVYDHCVFNDMHTGVNVFHTYPAVYSSIIGSTVSDPNEFLCDNYGVYARTNGNASTLDIINNNFIGGNYGVHLDGYSAYTIGHNDFLGEYAAVEPMATGSTHFNNVMNNNISSSTYGSHAIFDNYNLKYDDNCFGFNTLSDVYINTGIIFLDQGNEELANGNCFTKGGVPEIDNTGNPVIQLWVWKDEPISSCEYPTTVDNDPSFNIFVNPQSEDYTAENCGSMNTPGIVNIKTFCNGPYKTKQEKLDKIAEIEATIASIQADMNYSQAYKDYLIRIYKRCLDKLKIEVIIVILEPVPGDDGSMRMQKIEEAIAYASGLNTFELKLYAYGIMVSNDQLSRARSYLNGLTALEGEQANFIAAQNIYLDFLLDRKNYILSSQDENTLYNIGMGISPLDGYARSIYEVITGNHIAITIPTPRNSILPRSQTKQQQDILVNIYPNPATSGQLNINIQGQNEMTFQVSIYDLVGNRVYKENMNQGLKSISTTEWNAGIYIVNVKTDEGNVMVQKVAVTN